MALARIVLIRHGETVGNSSVRFHGRADVALSDEGRAQMRAVSKQLPGDRFELVVASPLHRSWESAAIVAPGRAVQLEVDFREIDFGRWEGLTRQEIEAREPALARDWLERREGFEFPGGERRADFRARVERALDSVIASGASSAVIVSHKGVIRAIVGKLTGELPIPEQPTLGGVLQVTRKGDGTWFLGRRSSEPPGLAVA